MCSNITLIGSVLLYFGITLLINLGNTELCEECITPDPENLKGWCVPAKDCPIIGDILGLPLSRFPSDRQKFIKNSKCSSDGAENYCCAETLIEPKFLNDRKQVCNVKKNFKNLCEECITPDSENLKGWCVPVKYCPIIDNSLGLPLSRISSDYQKFIKNSKCSSDGAENYCCAETLIEPKFLNDRKQFCNVSIIQKFEPEIFQPPTVFRETNYEPSTFDLDAHPNLKLLTENENCGLSGDGDKIAYGKITDIDEFPFMALLQYDRNETDVFKCGGTLINKNYVLTAAHCIKPSLFSVRLGEHNIGKEMDCQTYHNKKICNAPVQNIPIAEIYVHNFIHVQHRTNVNDIALIRLKTPANTTVNSVGFVCLPTTAELREIKIEKANVVGWGETEKQVVSQILLKGSVDVNKERQKCVDSYKNEYKININEKFLCAIGTRGANTTDTCNGDSGGPLIAREAGEAKERFVQYGIVSAGPLIPCAQVYDIGGAIYTNVPPYMRWILDKMRE